ncbi:MFS transporter [Variovorax dokdonensis]|uniref:MFS transporter n=1 Tax=Variovorax dokdonensis TaxID=344883 RepID=A0ABT7N6V6_9BURK|nr:MFS transporter [Variovorax dokdonensis]MDM0043678.1 MFS transporter [Variovorax dokdonensis]
MPLMLWALLAGNFAIGTGVMAAAATLNEISAFFGVSVSVAGYLITAAGVVVCVGAPALASVVAPFDRRHLLALSMLWYGAMHALCTLAPSFGWLLVLRVLAVVPAAVFTPQAAACAGMLVPLAQRGRAITFVFVGWSLASVLGMPLNAWLSGAFGWQGAYLMVAALSFASAGWLWYAMPANVRPPRFALSNWGAALRSQPLMLCIAVTLLSAAGQFVLFAYFAPYFKTTLGASAQQLGALFLCFGAFGLVGNVLMSRFIDRIGAPRGAMIAMVGMALSLLLWPVGETIVLAAIVAIPWALGCFSANSAQQARLVALAPSLASGSIALNTSAMYAGQAIGAAAGGWLIDQQGMGSLHMAGLVLLVLAMVTSVAATRSGTRAAIAAADDPARRAA